MRTLTAAELREHLVGDAECAILDVRDAGEISQGHIPGVTALPRRMIEIQIDSLLHRLDTPILLCDDGGTRAWLAAATLEEAGYTDVAVLNGGLSAWVESGGALAKGKNVPTKAFAEELLVAAAVPQMEPAELARRMTREDMVVVDIRAADEHVLGHIPTAVNIPGVEVAARAGDLADRRVPVIVHCAGRTRSILACETLRLLGLECVYALQNGTMGWTLSGNELEHEERYPQEPPSEMSRAHGRRASRSLALDVGVESASVEEVLAWARARAAGESNCYLFDVRQAGAFAEGHVPGSRSIPGGQAVLFADEHVAVRNARIVMIDEDETLASMTAYWFRRLGYARVAVLSGGMNAWRSAGHGLEKGMARAVPLFRDRVMRATARLQPKECARWLAANRNARIVDVNTSKRFAKGHLEGARWVSRGSLEDRVGSLVPSPEAPVLVCCQNGLQSAYAAETLQRLGYRDVKVLEGGVAAWGGAGLPLASGTTEEMAGSADLVQNPYDRTREDMIRYLNWEKDLGERR